MSAPTRLQRFALQHRHGAPAQRRQHQRRHRYVRLQPGQQLMQDLAQAAPRPLLVFGCARLSASAGLLNGSRLSSPKAGVARAAGLGLPTVAGGVSSAAALHGRSIAAHASRVSETTLQSIS